MTRRIVTVIAGALLATAGVPAQTPPPQPAPAAAQPAPVEPQGFTYNAEGRRDPFVSLLRRGADTQRLPGEMRPPGVAGLQTEEVTLKGIMQSRGGYVALVQGADQKTYIVRSGDKLLDGTIQSITADSVVILQQVDDPLSLEKQREVRKPLRQTEEVK